MPGNSVPVKMIKQTFIKLKDTAAFFIAVANAFNPLAYRGISQKSLKSVITYSLYLLLITTLIATAIILPSLSSLDSGISSQLGRFSQLSVKTELATKEPIESEISWLGNMKVFINTTADAKTTAKYDIALTGSELRVKPLLCFFRNEVCSLLGVGQHSSQIKEIDVLKSAGKAPGTLSALLLVMLPGLLVIFYASLLLKYVAVALAAAVLSYAVLKLTKKDTGFLDALKITIYAATVLVALDAASFLLRHTSLPIPAFVPLAAYIAVLVTAFFFNEQALADRL